MRQALTIRRGYGKVDAGFPIDSPLCIALAGVEICQEWMDATGQPYSHYTDQEAEQVFASIDQAQKRGNA